MKQIAFFPFLLFLISNSFGQGPSIQWQKSLGGTSDDEGYSIEQTFDGGYIVAGTSQSNDGDVTGNHAGSYDCWVAKLNTVGVIQWQKSLGGSSSDETRSIQQTTDGGYVFVARSRSLDGDVTGHHGGSTNNDYWVVKLDSIGVIVWQNSYGGTGNDDAYSIQQTLDMGYIVAGNSQSNDGDVTGHHGSLFPSDYWILKIDSVGNIQWQKSIGGTSVDGAFSIQQISDHGYIVGGSSGSNDGDVTGNNGNTDFWVVKLDTTGTIAWQKSLGGTLDDFEYSIKQTNDSGFITAGWTASNDNDVSGNHGGLYDCWVVKLDSIGAIQWQKCLGGTDLEESSCIEQTQDNGFILSGFSQSNDGDLTSNQGGYDSFVVKLDTTGNIEWTESLGGTSFDFAESIQQTIDGGYIWTGTSNSNDGDVIGHQGSTATGDFWVVKLSPLVTGLTDVFSENNFTEYPNPAQAQITVEFDCVDAKNISVEIKNVLGQNVKSISSRNFLKGRNKIEINVSGFLSGLYFVQMQMDSKVISKKFIKE